MGTSMFLFQDFLQTISGYIAKKLSKRSKCDVCPSKMISYDKDNKHYDYLLKLSRGGLIFSSSALSDFVIHSFGVLDVINPILKSFSSEVPIRKIAEKSLQSIINDSIAFTCSDHEGWGDAVLLHVLLRMFSIIVKGN